DSLRELGHVVINRAELVMPLADTDISKYGPIDALEALHKENGRFYYIRDVVENHYGGEYSALNREYVFNVTRQLQYMLDRSGGSSADDRLFIVNRNRALNARRGIFNGPGHSERPLKLRLTYTII